MKLKVNPNRMELMRLRRRLSLAQRGHKLLKDKLEELMRNFLEAARQFNRIKEEVDQEFRIITRSMAMVRVTQAQAELSGLIKDGELQLEVKTGRLLNLTVPEFELKDSNLVTMTLSGQKVTGVAIKHFRQLWPKLLEYDQPVEKLELLTTEIEVTRRRVNALEYILIPNLKETIQAISSRLEEMERSYQVQLMRVKEIVRKH